MADPFKDSLLIGAFEGIYFPVLDAQTDGGNDNVKHVAYKRRGADIEPTGLKAYAGTLKIALINGLQTWEQLFPDVYHDLIGKFESTPIGRLQHPTKGAFTACIETWQEQLTGKSPRNGVMLDVRWTEHNGEATLLPTQDGQSAANNNTNAATIEATEADEEMAAVTSDFQPVSATVDVQLTFLGESVRSYTEIVGAVRSVLVIIDANLALPALAGPEAHAAVAALEKLRATMYTVREQALGTMAQPRTYVVQKTQPLWQIAYDIYQDSSKSQLLATVNSVVDPTFVPAGKKLLVPPL